MIDFDTITDEISNYEDIIDSRDVIARIEELEELAESAIEAEERMPTELAEELTALRKVAEEGEGFDDWTHGATLIRESYFETYAQDLCEEVYEAPKTDGGWSPYNYIDWSAVSRDMRMDYSSIDFNGETYYIR